jgi:hypothetical protein
MDASCSQALPARRTFLLYFDGLLNACNAEDMATRCCGGLLHLIPTYRAGKSWFLGDFLICLSAEIHSQSSMQSVV